MSLPSVTVRRLRLIAIVVVFFTLALANTAIAQELSAIIGQVRDESGAILPGVTVSVTSQVLQVKEVTDVTNAQGEYRITPLPIGTYTVSYQLDGFSTHAAGRRPARPGRDSAAGYHAEARHAHGDRDGLWRSAGGRCDGDLREHAVHA